LIDRATPLATLRGLIASIIVLLLACVPSARAAQPAVSAARLTAYLDGVTRAWVPYTTADGRVQDPLKPADTGDNYGVIMLADVMLKVAKRTGDSELQATGVDIIDSALTLPAPNDPFNLLAIAAVIRDGQRGEFPASAWEQVAAPLALLAGQIVPPRGRSCLTKPSCYSNWRLVWSAGAALLQDDHLVGQPGSLAQESGFVNAQIKADLQLAVSHAGALLQSSVARGTGPGGGSRSPALTTAGLGGRARELSDRGAEPPAYELFSAFLLELLDEASPSSITPAVARLQSQSDRYALDMMAPDGQLSLAGRSLDQSWVQAAAAALGARRAALEPALAGVWRTYAERAISYLLNAYPLRSDGLLPIVPGLSIDWSPSIVDSYAALNQYEGLTLWFLSYALDRWPSTQAQGTSLPADNKSLLVDDLSSSGLAWGRAGGVWWELSGRSTSGDPRAAQGLVAIKVNSRKGWRDLLALRPIHSDASSKWILQSAHKVRATPTFTRVRGTGGAVELLGRYEGPGDHGVARVSWTLNTSEQGARLSMSMPAGATLHTTVWLTPRASHQLAAPDASIERGACLVSASGMACPVTIFWRDQHTATLEIGPTAGAI
jgi:hypothetical protein